MAHGSVEDLHKAKMYHSKKAKMFIKEVLKMEPWHLALKFKAYVTSGLAGKSRCTCEITM